MGCVKLSEKNRVHLPTVGEQTANKLPNFTQPMGSNNFGPSILPLLSLSFTKGQNASYSRFHKLFLRVPVQWYTCRAAFCLVAKARWRYSQ